MKRYCYLAVLAALVSAGPARAGLVIDDFGSTTYPYPAPTGFVQGAVGQSTIAETGLPEGATFGGVRTATISVASVTSTGDFANFRVDPSPTGSGGSLSYASTTGTDGALRLAYGPGPDLDLAGHHGIRVDLLEFDHANGLDMTVILTLTDASGAEMSETLAVSSAGRQTLTFALTGFSGLDLGQIRTIGLTFDAGLSSDFRLASITAVPEPGGLACVGMGATLAAGLAWRRRPAPAS
jgi:hypothetical protein